MANESSLGNVRVSALLDVLSICLYLILWVANGELLQGIASGTLCPQGIAYDKPAFLTWFDYNFLLLGLPIVWADTRFRRGQGLTKYLTNIWPGSFGFCRSIAACAAISCLLIALNILFVIGLECVSVATSNAIYQLQTAFTIGLCVWILGDKFSLSEGVGLAASLIGVALIVLPPLVNDENVEKATEEGGDDRKQSCPSHHAAFLGSFAMLGSAALWGGYQVAWRVLSEVRENPESQHRSTHSRLDGFMDTLTTLAMVGACNLTLGLPVLILIDYFGFETFYPPPQSHKGILIVNALVEYGFDVSCAVAIYMTSPIITAVTAPLTIPISLLWDHALYKSSLSEVGWWGLIGTALVLAGVMMMETKPDLSKITLARWQQREKTALLETEMQGGNYAQFSGLNFEPSFV
uniref:EamA domain-containing protein n=1 Tax=Trieres chinensis TaxID=1514140 RepID=A0A7S1ZP28_TRICV